MKKTLRKAPFTFLLVLLGGVLWSVLHPEASSQSAVQLSLELPSQTAWLGRDSLGRDLFARILSGAQVSMGLGLLSSVAAFSMGLLYGALSAQSSKWIDSILMRFCEILMSLPNLMLMAVISVVLQTQISSSSWLVIFGALTLGSWMPIAKVARNLILQERQKAYIEAAHSLGADSNRIFFRHLLPNLVSPLLVYWSLQIPHAILSEGILSFLGFGVKSPGVSWGILLQEGWKTLAAYPHLLLGPALFLFLTVLSLNLCLENFRKSIDPQLKWEKFS